MSLLVDITFDAITLNDSSTKLKPHQLSQINYWGFSKEIEENIYKSSTKELDAILPKLLNYFDKEKISYSLSPVCKQLIDQINQRNEYFENIKTLGLEYKEGKFDTNKFNEFTSFINKKLPRLLKIHQLKAAYHLYLLQNGANFSVPGSGKTSTVLATYAKLKSEGKVNLLFIVGPPACFAPWKSEFAQTLGYEAVCKILAGGDQIQRKNEYFSFNNLAELYLTTFQSLTNDQTEVITFFNKQGLHVYLVIDEAHYIKQKDGVWATAVLNISKYVKYRSILTGTPLPKSYTDAFNLFDFLWPYKKPINDDVKITIDYQEKNGNIVTAKELLKQNIDPLFYRVRKSDLGLIPPIFHPPYLIKMNKNEEIIYKGIVSKIKSYDKDDYLRNIELIMKLRRGRIIRLRQCTSYAKLLSTVVDNYNEDLIGTDHNLSKIICNYDELEVPAKLEFLLKFVNSLRGKNQKVVIWAHFIGTLELILKYLLHAGHYCKLIYGKTPIEQTLFEEEETREFKEEENREKIREEFIDPNSGLDILIANPAACGESISLHKTCFHAMYYDLSYNCAQYLQSLDRIHRVGGSETNQAHYYFLQYENSIDQDIKLSLDNKAKKMYDVIEEDYEIYSLDMFEEEDEIQAYERLFGNE
jgi:superfamily II DNA or RNA helicase